MKKYLYILNIIFSIFILCSCNINKNNIEEISTIQDNYLVDIEDKDLNNLISSIKISEPYEDYYDRYEYTSSSQYYICNEGHEYYSIRQYSYYESKCYNPNTELYTDPYTNNYINIDDTDYDHIIPLHYVNKHGGNEWSDDQKKKYADDPLIGIDVNSSDNRAKGDKGPSQWLPEENVENYCYSWLIIANKYNISISQEDMNVIKEVLKNDDINNLNVINEY